MNPRSARRVTGVVLVLTVVTGCAGTDGGGSAAPTGSGSVPGNASGSTPAPAGGGSSSPVGPAATPPAAVPFPQELVGEWRGGEQRRPATVTFAPDGSWIRRASSGATISSGVAVVEGGVILWRADDGTTSSSSVSLGGGVLYLDGYSYLRLDASSADGTALIGSWIDSSSFYVTLRLDGNGRAVVEDQVNGTASGTYAVSGRSIAFAVPGLPVPPLDWSVDGGTLTLTAADGSTSTWFRSG